MKISNDLIGGIGKRGIETFQSARSRTLRGLAKKKFCMRAQIAGVGYI